MKLLGEINLEHISKAEAVSFRTRQTARAALFDADKKIALLYVGMFGYHKLPGGGVERGEDLNSALIRECLEETGCAIEVIKEIGSTIEYRAKYNLVQTSFCYVANVKGEKGELNFTPAEIEQEFELQWVSLSDALHMIQVEEPTEYEGTFIVQRDVLFLNEIIKLYAN